MRILLGLLPAFTIFAWVIALHIRHSRRNTVPAAGISEAIMQGVVLAGGWIVLGTESLGAVNALRFWPILLWWVVPFVVATVYIVRHRRSFRIDLSNFKPLDVHEWAIAIPLIAIMLLAFLTAILYPPATGDVLTYHLPRQIIWMQHGNVSHYSTHNIRQIIMPPLAEFMGLHVLILSQSDRLHNLIQWASLLIMFVPMSLITRRLGGNRAAQIASCLILVVCPIVFMQVSNAKNDIVVGMWMLIAVEWTLAAIDSTPSPGRAVLLGLAIGCAALTKGTGELFVIPVVVVLSIVMLRRFNMRSVTALVLAGVVALSLNLPHFSRNWKMCHNIAGPTLQQGGYDLYNATHSPLVLLSNVLRNLAFQAGLPSKAINKAMFDGVVWLHQHVLNISVNERATTTGPDTTFRVPYLPTDESRAGAPLHLALVLTLPVMMFLSRRRMNIRLAVLLFSLASAGFLLFCFAIKWHEFHNRYFVTLGGMVSPLIAVAWSVWIPRRFVGLIGLAFAASLVPTLMKHSGSSSRPVLSSNKLLRESNLKKMLLFVNHVPEYVGLDEFAKTHRAKSVGLITNTGDFPEYVIQRIFLDYNHSQTVFRSIDTYFKFPEPPGPPLDVVIAPPELTGYFDESTGTDFEVAIHNSTFNVLVPAGKLPVGTPAFTGCVDVSGLDPRGGPIPELHLPVVQWGIFPESRLTVRAREAGPHLLRLVMRRNNRNDQRVTVQLNGKTVSECALPIQVFISLRTTLQLHAGDNELVLKYAAPDVGATTRLGVLFQAIQVLPIDTTGKPAQ